MRPDPFDPAEVGVDDHELDAVTMALERYAANTDAVHDPELVARIQAAVDAEPLPRRGWLASLTGGFRGGGVGARALALAGIAAAAIVTAVAVGGLLDLARTVEPGDAASPVVSPSVAPMPTESPSPSNSASPTASPSTSQSPTPSASPSGGGDETASPSASDGSGNSGPGGGGGDNSGPGSSGSGSGPGSSGSGSGSGSDDGSD
jgi:hypothetical protein